MVQYSNETVQKLKMFVSCNTSLKMPRNFKKGNFCAMHEIKGYMTMKSGAQMKRNLSN